MDKIILASASPRRAELLHQIGLEFDVVVSGVAEDEVKEKDPIRLAECLALSKAHAVAASVEHGIVIAADTVVYLDEEFLGKPEDEQDAMRMLRLLSGRSHQVMTGVVIIKQPDMQTLCQVETTTVYMRSITEEEIRWYINTGESNDKAGSYAIQGYGAIFVERIEGDYFNVVGLPLCRLSKMLEKFRYSLTE